VIIRPASDADAPAIWHILGPVIRAGETYALPCNMSREEAVTYWFSPDYEVFVAEADGDVVGTYHMRPNRAGGGAHVANCGYVTLSTATGRGIARAMCEHSLHHARKRGFRSMQFNFVVSTNMRAVGLWQSCGFEIVGRLPGAFRHPTMGFVDAYVMFREL
jgi:L-amino acid N-acyltransferase YncA